MLYAYANPTLYNMSEKGIELTKMLQLVLPGIKEINNAEQIDLVFKYFRKRGVPYYSYTKEQKL